MIKRNRNNFPLIIVFFFCSINFVFGQQETPQGVSLNKNAIYANVGTAGLYFTATGYYERMITQSRKIATFAKIGIGGYGTIDEDSGEYILAQYGLLTGAKKKHHLEIGAGPAYSINDDDGVEGELLFTATVGWRIQKPGKNFMFRMGASFPEALYVGLGYSF